MNEQLRSFAKAKLKEWLAQLPESNQALFKRMYSHDNLNRNINDVVNLMPDNKLDLAMQQVERTLLSKSK